MISCLWHIVIIMFLYYTVSQQAARLCRSSPFYLVTEDSFCLRLSLLYACIYCSFFLIYTMMMMNMSIKIIHSNSMYQSNIDLCMFVCVCVWAFLLYNIVVLSHILYLFIIYYNNCILWVKEHIFKDECAMWLLVLLYLLNFVRWNVLLLYSVYLNYYGIKIVTEVRKSINLCL